MQNCPVLVSLKQGSLYLGRRMTVKHNDTGSAYQNAAEACLAAF